MDEESQSPTPHSDPIPTLDEAVEPASPWAEQLAERLEAELNREFDRLVGQPVAEALDQGLAAYRAQLRSILLRELRSQQTLDEPTEPSR